MLPACFGGIRREDFAHSIWNWSRPTERHILRRCKFSHWLHPTFRTTIPPVSVSRMGQKYIPMHDLTQGNHVHAATWYVLRERRCLMSRPVETLLSFLVLPSVTHRHFLRLSRRRRPVASGRRLDVVARFSSAQATNQHRERRRCVLLLALRVAST